MWKLVKKIPLAPALYVSAWAVLLFVIAGCSTTKQLATIEYEQRPIDCSPIPYPQPLSLKPVAPLNQGTYWEFSHTD